MRKACAQALAELELRYKFAQATRFRGQRGACGIGFFNHRCILLGHLVHLVDRGVDFRKADRLFARGGGDRIHVLVDRDDIGLDRLQRRAGFADQLDAGLDLDGRLADEVLDLLGCLGGALGQFAHFLCDNGKALARFTGTRGLDAGVECQKIGLEGNVIDHADDVGNLAGRFLDPFHGVDRVGNDDAGLAGAFICLDSNGAGFFRTLRRVRHVGRDLVEGSGGFFQRSGLLFGPLGKIVGALADLARARIDRACRLGDRTERSAQLRNCGVEICAQAFEFLGEGPVELECQIAGGEVLETCGKAIRGFSHRFCTDAGILGIALALLFGEAALCFRFAFKRLRLQGVVLEHLNSLRHRADLVAAVETRDLAIGFSRSKFRHAVA
ncbi:hypothetical protein D3C73_857410 [compost metagenome]